MLKLIQIPHPQARRQRLEEFDPRQQTWVVSDLKSKLILQSTLLDRFPMLEDDAVLRASEIWKKIFFRIKPEVRIISRDLAQSIIADELEKISLDWVGTAGAPSEIYRMLTQLSGVLSHPEGHERLGDWFRQNLENYIRWGEWYRVARGIWTTFAKRQLIATDWLTGALSNLTLTDRIWPRSIILDLGVDLQSFESEIVTQLARFIDIEVLEPKFGNEAPFRNLKTAYQTFAHASREQHTFLELASTRFESKRFATMVSEVKDVTAQVRAWIEQGVAPGCIAVIAPDAKNYLQSLLPYFEHEGIPTAKGKTSRLADLPEFSRWLAQIDFLGGDARSEDLERMLFSPDKQGPLAYQKFKVLMGRIYSDEDLARMPDILEELQNKRRSKSERISRDGFILWAVAYYFDSSNSEYLELVLKPLLQECPINTQLTLKEWIRYLQSRVRKIDLTLETEMTDGVSIINLDAAEDLNFTHAVVLGLTDDALRSQERSRVDVSESASITALTGLLLPMHEPSKLEYKIRWITQGRQHVVLSAPMTDFKGQTLAPSLFWLEIATPLLQDRLDECFTPGLTVWDSLQRGSWDDLRKKRNWTQGEVDLKTNRLKGDLGFESESNFNGQTWKRLSPSAIEDYRNCPFIFAAKRAFNITDEPELDLDIDHLTRGRLIHKLFEILLTPIVLFDRKEDELDKIVETAKYEAHVLIGEPRFWTQIKTRYKKMALRFLEFEKEWRTRFPQTQTVGREVHVKGFWNSSTQSLQKTEGVNTIPFIGVIDRVDSDGEGRAVILDYKSSKAKLRQFSSWIESNLLQLGLYAMAIENGLSDLVPHQVVGAFYYSTRDFDRKLGFRLDSTATTLFNFEDKSKNKISQPEKETFFQELNKIMSDVALYARAGKFKPAPREEKLCDSCSWKALCRAPHLN